MTQKEHRGASQSCRDGVRKVKVDLEMNLARNVNYINKGFYKYIKSKGKTRENMGLLLNGPRGSGDKGPRKSQNSQCLISFSLYW